MKYEVLSQRFYKFFKYCRMMAIIFLVLFLGVTAFNTDNSTLSVISYLFMVITFASVFESIVLYILYLWYRNK